jgi:hypothetical protein
MRASHLELLAGDWAGLVRRLTDLKPLGAHLAERTIGGAATR